MTRSPEVPEIDVTATVTRLDEGAVLLDVREVVEWEAGHVESAVHIPLGELGARHSELTSDALLLVICRSGGRSADATRALRGAGYDAHNVAGGMKAWVKAGQPIEPASGFVA